MKIENIIARANQNFVVLSAPQGQIGLNLGVALAHAEGCEGCAKDVIRTTKNLNEIKTRTITESEANEALDFVVAALREKLQSVDMDTDEDSAVEALSQ